mmetsp:Transcript_43603/g.83188  ORF Transcript_43603/g.83188 Transcript_43603/m.83188 type:complete len:259 (+) Transcript_43603:162-938(+)
MDSSAGRSRKNVQSRSVAQPVHSQLTAVRSEGLRAVPAGAPGGPTVLRQAALHGPLHVQHAHPSSQSFREREAMFADPAGHARVWAQPRPRLLHLSHVFLPRSRAAPTGAGSICPSEVRVCATGQLHVHRLHQGAGEGWAVEACGGGSGRDASTQASSHHRLRERRHGCVHGPRRMGGGRETLGATERRVAAGRRHLQHDDQRLRQGGRVGKSHVSVSPRGGRWGEARLRGLQCTDRCMRKRQPMGPRQGSFPRNGGS